VKGKKQGGHLKKLNVQERNPEKKEKSGRAPIGMKERFKAGLRKDDGEREKKRRKELTGKTA